MAEPFFRKFFDLMATPGGLEPPAYGLGKARI